MVIYCCKCCKICCNISMVCLTILGHYSLKSYGHSKRIHYKEIAYPVGHYIFKVNNKTLEEGVKYVQG